MNENLGNDKNNNRYGKDFIKKGDEVANIADIMRYNAYKKNKEMETSSQDNNVTKQDNITHNADADFSHTSNSTNKTSNQELDNIKSDTHESDYNDNEYSQVEDKNTYKEEIDNSSSNNEHVVEESNTHYAEKKRTAKTEKDSKNTSENSENKKEKKGKVGKVIVSILTVIVLLLVGTIVYFLNTSPKALITIQHKNVDASVTAQCIVAGEDINSTINGKEKDTKSFTSSQSRTETFEVDAVYQIKPTSIVQMFFTFTNESSDDIILNLTKQNSEDNNFKISIFYQLNDDSTTTSIDYFSLEGKYYTTMEDLRNRENGNKTLNLPDAIVINGGKVLNMRIELSVNETSYDAQCVYNFDFKLSK